MHIIDSNHILMNKKIEFKGQNVLMNNIEIAPLTSSFPLFLKFRKRLGAFSFPITGILVSLFSKECTNLLHKVQQRTLTTRGLS